VVVEHEGESGVVLLNDWTLDDRFGGRCGFETQLAKQGFTNIINIETPEELEAAEHSKPGKKLGNWAGPWQVQYPGRLVKGLRR
jgi:hypothetical protein